MSEFKFEFGGFEELSKSLNEMAKGTTSRVFRKSFAQAIAFYEAQLKATSAWADRTGELRGSIGSRTSTRKGTVQASVSGLYRGRFLEFGWIPGKRPTTRQGRRDRALEARGFIPAKPWIRPVFEANKDKTVDEIFQALTAEVTKALNRHAKKTKGK